MCKQENRTTPITRAFSSCMKRAFAYVLNSKLLVCFSSFPNVGENPHESEGILCHGQRVLPCPRMRWRTQHRSSQQRNLVKLHAHARVPLGPKNWVNVIGNRTATVNVSIDRRTRWIYLKLLVDSIDGRCIRWQVYRRRSARRFAGTCTNY